MYSQQASVDSAKLHQSKSSPTPRNLFPHQIPACIHSEGRPANTHLSVSVEFLRRSLKNRPSERAGSSAGGTRSSNTGSQESGGKRKSGQDNGVSSGDIDIYDEACREIRLALDAYAVAVVDLSQFHLFYPAYQSSSTAGTSARGDSATYSASSQTRGNGSTDGGSTVHGGGGGGSMFGASSNNGQGSVTSESNTIMMRGGGSGGSGTTIHPAGSRLGGGVPGTSSSTQSGTRSQTGDGDEPNESYSKPRNRKTARKTYAVTDPTAPSRTPQVLFIPSRKKSNYQKKGKGYKGDGQDQESKEDEVSTPFLVMCYSRVQ
jgi:hypothetical protein